MSKCNKECEVYSRVVGYHRPVANWNKGKKSEFGNRKTFSVEVSLESAHGKCKTLEAFSHSV